MNNANTKIPTSSKTFKQNKLLTGVSLLLLLFFLIQFFQKEISQKDYLFFWPENFLFYTENTFISLRDDDQAHVLIKAVSSSKNRNPLFFSLENSEKSPLVKKIDEGLFRVKNSRSSFFIFTKEFNTLSELPSISFENDWWILEKTVLPQSIPYPKKGVLFIGSNPGKSLILFCKENNLPLLVAKKSLWSIEKKNNSFEKVRRYVYP